MTDTLFSMVVNGLQNLSHFPTVPFSGGLRLWDTGVRWLDLETAPSVFNWSNLDAQLAVASMKGKDVLYAFGDVPGWANHGNAPGVPPTDIAAGNLRWKLFVAKLVIHSLESPSVRIGAYEIWNEPNVKTSWGGTPAQLLRMASDAHAIIKALDPGAIVVGPAGSGGSAVDDFIKQYYTQARALAMRAPFPQDVFNYHAYLDDGLRVPTELPALLKSINDVMAGAGVTQPLWFTEGSWGEMSSYNPSLTPDEQVAYLAQLYVQMWAAGVARFYWYAWDNPSGWGALWTAAGGPTPAGIGYGVLSGWLTGALPTAPGCTANSNGTLTLPLALAKGVPAQIVWHPTATHSLSTPALTFSTLDGKTFPVKNGTVTVGPKPILLTL